MQCSKKTAGLLAAIMVAIMGLGMLGFAPVTAEQEMHAPIVSTSTTAKTVTKDTVKEVKDQLQKEAEEKAKKEAEEKAAAEAAAKAAEEKAAAEKAAAQRAAAAKTTTTQAKPQTAQVQQTSAPQAPAQTQTQVATSGSAAQDGLARYILSCNPSIGAQTAQQEAAAFIRYGNMYGVRPALLAAMAKCESNFTPRAYNGAGYYGLMQVSNSVGSSYAGCTGQALFNIDTNVRAGAGYLGANIRMFGNETQGLSGYMYGSGAVKAGNYNPARANSRIALANQIQSYMQ